MMVLRRWAARDQANDQSGLFSLGFAPLLPRATLAGCRSSQSQVRFFGSLRRQLRNFQQGSFPPVRLGGALMLYLLILAGLCALVLVAVKFAAEQF